MGDNCSVYSALVRPQPHSCVQAKTMHFKTNTAADKFKTAQPLNRGTSQKRSKKFNQQLKDNGIRCMKPKIKEDLKSKSINSKA